MSERIIRDASLRLKLSPEAKVRLERLSHLMGVPPSTLAAVWLGQAIATQERSLSMASKLADSVGSEMGAILRNSMPDLFAALSVGDSSSEVTAKQVTQ